MTAEREVKSALAELEGVGGASATVAVAVGGAAGLMVEREVGAVEREVRLVRAIDFGFGPGAVVVRGDTDSALVLLGDGAAAGAACGTGANATGGVTAMFGIATVDGASAAGGSIVGLDDTDGAANEPGSAGSAVCASAGVARSASTAARAVAARGELCVAFSM
jgi:hypothetical protein